MWNICVFWGGGLVNPVNKVAVRVGGLLASFGLLPIETLLIPHGVSDFFILWSCLVRKDRHVANLLKFLFLATLAPATFEDFFTN